MSGSPNVEERLRSALRGDAERLHPSPVPPPGLRRRVRRRAIGSIGVSAALVLVVVAGAVVTVGAARRAVPPLPVGPSPAVSAPATPTPGPTTTAPAPPPCSTWSVVPAPGHDAEGFDTSLTAVTAPSPDVALAVGDANEQELNGPMQVELQRWDGTRWSRQPAPDLQFRGNGPSLQGVDASGADSAWAVGGVALVRGVVPLALRWDGVSWTQSAVPDDPASTSAFHGVVTLAADDAWAVGNWGEDFDPRGGPLVAHWDGTAWSVTDQPTTQSPGTPGTKHDFLSEVDGTSATDVWAVGAEFDFPETYSRTLIEHWDGAAWQRVPSPNLDSGSPGGGGIDTLWGVDAIAPDDVWAVGSSQAGAEPGHSGPVRPLMLHWDGTGWGIVPVRGIDGAAYGVAATSPTDVWAVGFTSTEGKPGTFPLLMHWDGRSWTTVPAPTDEQVRLTGIAAIPGGGMWAVGRPLANGPHESLKPPVVYRCG